METCFVQLQKSRKVFQVLSALGVGTSFCYMNLQLPRNCCPSPVLYLLPALEEGVSASLHLLADSELPKHLHGQIHRVFKNKLNFWKKTTGIWWNLVALPCQSFFKSKCSWKTTDQETERNRSTSNTGTEKNPRSSLHTSTAFAILIL